MDRFASVRNCIFVLCAVSAGAFIGGSAHAHFPHYESKPVHPRIDVIPPLGNRIPSYRERYNRPTYIGGKIAYLIEPSSQEAMSWHRSAHRGYYANHSPRMEDRYFYPKAWEVLTVGPRVPLDASTIGIAEPANRYASSEDDRDDETIELLPSTEDLPAPTE
jgi:hypothetical protein